MGGSRVAIADDIDAARNWVAARKNPPLFKIYEYIGGNASNHDSYKEVKS